MNVYDFDNTIYDGESVVDFFLYYCKKDPLLLRFLPQLFVALMKYKRGKITVEQALARYGKKFSNYYVRHIGIEEELDAFWDKHIHKIKPFYKDIQSDDDLIISGSPESSLNIICNRLGIKNYIGSLIDSKTGEVKRLCIREKKVSAFFEEYPNAVIENFYTDSINDTPLIEISKNAFLVKGNKITKIK